MGCITYGDRLSLQTKSYHLLQMNPKTKICKPEKRTKHQSIFKLRNVRAQQKSCKLEFKSLTLFFSIKKNYIVCSR